MTGPTGNLISIHAVNALAPLLTNQPFLKALAVFLLTVGLFAPAPFKCGLRLT